MVMEMTLPAKLVRGHGGVVVVPSYSIDCAIKHVSFVRRMKRDEGQDDVSLNQRSESGSAGK